MTNTELLKEAIQKNGFKMYFVAEKIGLTRAGFHKKMLNQTEFTASEIAKLSELLCLSKKERDLIFLTVS